MHIVCFILTTFFDSLTLVEKLFDWRIYCLGTVRGDRKNMAIMKKDSDMKRGGSDFQYANGVVNLGGTLVGTCLTECKKVSTVTRRVK